MLSGALSSVALVGCGDKAPLAYEDHSYTNNYYLPGAGYYHAPYHAWYPFPYNYYVPGSGYYHGGTWTPEPHDSTITASHPSTRAVSEANAKSSSATKSSTTRRGGFGHSSHHAWS